MRGLVFVATDCWSIYENFEPHHKSLSSAMRATLYANWVFFQTLYKKDLVSLVVAWKLDYETCFSCLFIWRKCGRRPTYTHPSPWILCDRMSYSLQTLWSQNITQTLQVHSALISTIKTTWNCSNLLQSQPVWLLETEYFNVLILELVSLHITICKRVYDRSNESFPSLIT